MEPQFEHAQLDNGLNIIAEVNPDAHTAAIGFFVKTGARDEDPSVMGVSHFLEHMMFKGTETRTAEDVDRQFDELGASHNAFTTSEMTAFWAHCLPEHLPRAQEILSDIMRPTLRRKDFDDEKNVILEEIAMYEDQPFWKLYEATMERYFGEHRLSHRVLGTVDSITNLQRDQMAQYFYDRYSADNTVVALAGAVDFADMVKRIGEACGKWQRTDTHREFSSPAEITDQFTLQSPRVHQHYVLMAGPAPSIQDEQRYAANILSQVLGDSEGSRLYWALIETGLAEDAAAQYAGHDGLGLYLAFAACAPAQAEQVEQTINREIDGLIDSITEEDLTRVKNKIATSATFGGELPAGRMRRLGQQWTYLSKHIPLEDELQRINEVTLDDVRDVWKTFPIQPRVIGRLQPGDE